YEKIFEQLNTLEDIRKAANNNRNLKKAIQNSITDIKDLLCKRTKQLVLNENLFKCYDPVLDIDIDELFQEIKCIDNTLQVNETTWASLKKHNKLMEFLRSHCQQRIYSFQPSCDLCKPVKMLIEEFNSLNFLSDPILSTDEEQERGSNGLYTYKKIRGWVECTACGKWRCLYSQYLLSEEEELQWQTALQNNLYTCGGPILAEDHLLYNILFVREHISCNSPIETNYYACENGDKTQLCYWCGTEDDLSDIPSSLTDQYKIVYPCCNTCKELGKDYFTRLEIKVGKN
ncbi:33950_t:CDS:2, partial [Racocetra persica]